MIAAEVRARSAGGLALEAAAIVVGVVLPLAMFVSSRSSVTMLALAAVLASAGLIAEGRGRALTDLMLRTLRKPVFAALAATLAFFACSLAWTQFPASGAFAFAEFGAGVVSALVLGAVWTVQPPRHLGRLLAIGLAVAAAATIADLRSGMAFRHALGIRPNPYVLNRTVVCLLLLVWPMLALVRPGERLLAAIAALLVAGAIWHSESGAALIGALAALAVALIALVAPRVALAGLASGALAVLAVSPAIGPLLDRFLPEAVHKAMYGMHTQDRIEIWRAFGAAVEQRPWLGSGFNASARMAEDPVAQLVAEPNRTLLGAGHPHNAFLQIWVEGGLAGAALAALLIVIVARALTALRGAGAATTLAMTGAALAIAAVSHGAWQGWWIAIVGLGAVLAAQANRENGNV